jgi:hypothetical protein
LCGTIDIRFYCCSRENCFLRNGDSVAILTSTSKNTLSLVLIAFVFSPTKLEIRAEHILPGSEGDWGREGGGGKAMT